ncbi:MAG TPA: DUF1116 domain-containing protein [Chloroflexota bacterium]
MPILSEADTVLNIGLAGFAEPARALQLDWRPPANGDRELGLLVARLEDDPDDPIGAQVAKANATAVSRLLAARPLLVDVRPAREVVPELGDRLLLHAGPPIEWSAMCGPMRGAVVGAMLFEGWATDPAQAVAQANAGAIRFAPCHHFGAVGPMAGLLSPSMPVVVVQNDNEPGNRAFATMNEGLGKVLRFGAYDQSVLHRLTWMAATLGPSLSRALHVAGPIDLKVLIGQALQMGDECHNRNVAATALFARLLAPALVRQLETANAATVLDFLLDNNHFFLNLSMAACKVSLDAAHAVPGSTMVTAMARNGVEFGIRVSGAGDTWFTAPSTVPDGLYFAGYGPQHANPDLGDSAITETAGIGGFAMAAAPAIVRFVGGDAADALRYTQEMGRITLTRNPNYALPSLGFAGTPTGIDTRRVVESDTAPVINTGIAHREPGIGQIGAGIARAPLACFADGLRAVGQRLGVKVA